MKITNIFYKLFLMITLFVLANNGFALTLKVGLLAPEGTSWSKALKKMAKEVKAKTNNSVKIKFYFGGSQGDESDVMRKIRLGQLHGGVFTGKTLGDINGDIRVIELPFNFSGNKELAFLTVTKMASYFNHGLQKKGFQNLGFFEIGDVYYVSQKRSTDLLSLKGQKIWAWQGDELVAAMVESMNLVSVPLALPDVLSSLSTGIIEAAYGPALGIISLQWHTKIKFIIDYPISYSVGAFLFSTKSFSKISKTNQKHVRDISTKYLKEINSSNREDNKEALSAMKSLGITFLKFPEKDIEEGKKIRASIVKKLKGKLFSESAYKTLELHL